MSHTTSQGQHVPVLEVNITRHDPPRVSQMKDKDRNTYEVHYHFRVEFKYFGASRKMNCRDMEHVLEEIRANQTFFHPSWEQVTDNGRYSCD